MLAAIFRALKEPGCPDENAEVIYCLVNAAKGGDMQAASLLLRRLWPERKGRPVLLDLPPIETSADLGEAMGAILQAAADGELTPDEAVSVAMTGPNLIG